jgi:geranylgeranyl transferase type-2 subunit beta
MIETLTHGLKAGGTQTDKAVEYIALLQNPDGGFRGRTSTSDLYYTVFAVDILFAAGADFNRDRLIQYLKAINPGNLDFIHLCCQIRCAAVMNILEDGLKQRLIEQLKRFLCSDGLYHHVTAGQDASVYGVFMVFSAAQDLMETLIEPATLTAKLDKFRHPNGSYKNEYGQGAGTLPSTAAVMVMQSQIQMPVDNKTIDWVLSCMTEEDGFAVSPRMPVADLLSTATALQSLRQSRTDITALKDQCRTFVDSLRQNNGGFCANSFDPTVDAEYTFYGLLALGNLHD